MKKKRSSAELNAALARIQDLIKKGTPVADAVKTENISEPHYYLTLRRRKQDAEKNEDREYQKIKKRKYRKRVKHETIEVPNETPKSDLSKIFLFLELLTTEIKKLQ